MNPVQPLFRLSTANSHSQLDTLLSIRHQVYESIAGAGSEAEPSLLTLRRKGAPS